MMSIDYCAQVPNSLQMLILQKSLDGTIFTGEILEGDMNGFDSIIHLAGAGIGDKRWSKKPQID